MTTEEKNSAQRIIEALKPYEGKEVAVGVPTWIQEATIDTVLRWCYGVGDLNPLWLDEEYAKKSRFGAITTPPHFLIGVDMGVMAYNPDGGAAIPWTHIVDSGAEVEMFRPIWLGDRLTAKRVYKGAEEKVGNFRGSFCFCRGETSYYNQRRELVGIQRSWVARFMQKETKTVKFEDQPRAGGAVCEWPDVLVWQVKRRGAEPRYWEDVVEGEEMPPLHKGTFTISEFVRWMGGQFFGRNAPGELDATGKPDFIGRGHFQPDFAEQVGFGHNGYDFGPQRRSWIGQYLSDWMGDDGTLKRWRTMTRFPNRTGDACSIKGRVTRKYVNANGEHCVDCEVVAYNQAGTVISPADGTIALPTRSKSWKLGHY